MANQLGKIDHIVQLMLENRSFDQMLGFLYAANGNVSPVGHAFDGLTGAETNPDDTGRQLPVRKLLASDPHPYLMPGADPGEGYLNTNLQLFGTDDPAPGAVAAGQGFVVNFKAAIASDAAKHFKDSLPDAAPSDIMAMYTPELLPILSGLARGFAVCDAWFCSAPTQTIPNRAFAGAASAQGRLSNTVKNFTCPSIYGRLNDAGLDWVIYGYNNDPLTRTDFQETIAADDSHFGHFRDFQDRAAAGTLPVYSFLEPDFGADGNSQHPNYDVAAGEQLILDVYTALRNGPAWGSTLLVITYDEHGGNYDHVIPPTDATPPHDGTLGDFGFDFTRFGVRVPAVLVSPLIAPGTVYRPATGRLDHTSVLKTIHQRWKTKLLTKRDAAAAGLGDVLTLHAARTDDPIAGVLAPVSSGPHPNASVPSELEMLHAERVAALPIRNTQGIYGDPPPIPTSAADVKAFIRDRTAAWSQHLERQRRRRAAG